MAKSAPETLGARDAALADVSCDTLFDGRVELLQPRSGYRVNVDSLLLAAFCVVGRAPKRVVDLGAGVGAVSLALHHWQVGRHYALLEQSSELAALSAHNLSRAGASHEVHVHDVAESLPGALGSADLVVCNPPFFLPEENRISPIAAKQPARFGTCEPFLRATAQLLDGSRSRAAFVYPTRSLQGFLNQASKQRLYAKRLRLVHAMSDKPARLALLELRKAKPGGLVISPPLIEWDAPGRRSAELSAIISGQPRTPDR